MLDKDIDRLQELLRVASRLTPAARASFLACAEPGRADLRAEAGSLLAHDDGRGELLSVFPAEPQVLGPYRLRIPVGDAPPARLFRATDLEDSLRPVLLAVAGPGPAAARVAVALRGQLAHQPALEGSALTRLLDAGSTEDGHLYAAFEPTWGVPLPELADALRLSVAERVALLEAAALAIEELHVQGLAPLGIPPWAVLGTWGAMGPEVALLVVDPWPLLALVEPERRAQAELLACLETSAPEALRGEPRGVRTDVFALGALLYEAVTGTPPLGLQRLAGARSLREELRLAATIRPPRASARVAGLGREARELARLRSTSEGDLLRELRGGLDSILERALSADPSRRQVSAGELARELAQWRAGRGRGLLSSARELGWRIRPGARDPSTPKGVDPPEAG